MYFPGIFPCCDHAVRIIVVVLFCQWWVMAVASGYLVTGWLLHLLLLFVVKVVLLGWCDFLWSSGGFVVLVDYCRRACQCTVVGSVCWVHYSIRGCGRF